ncbi:MAG: bifunctional UDP-N-acetylglucosamine diphosphorylase/glucosamine-1-phosphate N-acetyltransferase GlmU [Nitrospiraceae bacterium]|nr:MAG: bifunctional UDP-N-acetylglucosamine diphosphorylase/glucosamine-1-phosphate N-acetyltransferase GlmU [Nitrospiraceae bacterium]
MKSRTPKVLHEVLGRPMLQHVIDAVMPLKPSGIITVVGNGAEEVKQRFSTEGISFVLQKQLLGTGNAVAVARRHIGRGAVLVLNGDGPLITTKTLRILVRNHLKRGNILSFLSFYDESLAGYGRVIRDKAGRVSAIAEDRHVSSADRKQFTELNGGVYLMEAEALQYLGRIRKNRRSGEYYLTDIVSIIARSGKGLDAYECPAEDILGVNSRHDLSVVSGIMRKRINREWMNRGVTFIDPDTTVVHSMVSLGMDTIVYPNTYLEGSTRIGKGCVIYPGSRVLNSLVGDGVMVKDNSLIEDSRVGDGASIGPCAHLRPQSVIGRRAKIGNFVEVKKSSIGEGAKASHLTYLGDAMVGADVNIGAGTITCNYDGTNKYRTVIEPGVFIGSDTQLVAPVKIGRGAYVAAGATVTRDVPPGALAISRVPQKNLDDWVQRKNSATAGRKGRK